MFFVLYRIKWPCKYFLADRYKYMSQTPSRGRPRQYDPEQALDAALGEFRRRGYTATSLDHLSEATKMARPSLYAAFGNKFEIYRKSVGRYADRTVTRRQQALLDEPSLRKGLADYFALIVEAYTPDDDGPLGCPILTVISGEAAADPAIRAELSAALKRTDARFGERLEIAHRRGEIAADADAQAIADLLAALQHSLALRARAGTERAELAQIAERAITTILKAAGNAG